MIEKIFSTVRSIGVALALAACVRSFAADAHQPASTTGIQQGVTTLSQSPGWQHLDVSWIDAVTLATADGPEMNVDVSVLSTDGQPVSGAVVALQESIFEAEPRVSLIPEPFQPVRAVAVTQADGSCRFDAVPMTSAANGKYGRIKAYVVIAHPTHGFDFYPLLRTSRNQHAQVTMREQVAMPLAVRGASRPQEVRVTKFDLRPELVYYSSGFIADMVFAPRAVVNEQGMGKFGSLPIEQFIGLDVRDQEGWKMPAIRALLPTKPKLAVIDLSEPAQQVPIRLIDPVTGRPIANVTVDRWRHPQQISDDDGLLVIKPAFPEFIFRLGQVDKLKFTVEPPARFVRERIWEYPHRIGSGPASFRLTPATIVAGRVVDAKTGEGIPSVVVQSLRPNVRPGGVTSQYHAVAVSDDSGSFELSAPPGRQTISVAAPVAGYLQPREQRLSVVIGKPVKNQTIRLTGAEPIRGRIVDQDGKAVAGAEVIGHAGDRAIRYRAGLPVDATIASGLTDDDGQFAIDRPQGQYDSLMIKAFFDNRQSRDAVVDFDPLSNRPIQIDLELSLGEQLRGVELVGIVWKDGKPWVGAQVTADPPGNARKQGAGHQGWISDRGSSQLGETTTDEQGRYRMVVEVSDQPVVMIGVRSAQRLHSAKVQLVTLSGSRIEVPPIEIREKAGDKSIKGVVVDPFGVPVADVHVVANRQRSFSPDRRTARENPHRATTNAKGEFQLRELYDGQVEIVVSPADIPAQYAVSSALSIPAGDANTRIVFDRALSRVPELIEPVATSPLSQPYGRIDFRADGSSLDPRTRVRGVVVDQTGTPVDEAIVRVYCVTPSISVGEYGPFGHPSCRLATKTNSQGQFAIGPFPAGARVRIAAGANGLSARVTEFLSLDEQGASVEIKLTRIDPDLPAMKTTHQLIDSLGKPVPGAVVATSYQDYADVLKFSSDAGPCVLTDAQGNFRFPTVAGVDYMTVGAFPIVGPASVIRNDYSHRKYSLANPMSIRGRVVDEHGQPIKGFIVQVHNDRTVGAIRVATAGDGTFRIDDVPCGEVCFLSGSSSSQPKHSLLQRRFACALRKELNFADLSAIPSTPLAVKFVPAAGKVLPADLSVQIGSTRITVPADGNIVFPSVGPGSVGLRINGQVSGIGQCPHDPARFCFDNMHCLLHVAVVDRRRRCQDAINSFPLGRHFALEADPSRSNILVHLS